MPEACLDAGLYCFKFFLWETGYWKTMDIAHDRAGYYLCWGCLNWVPGVYTSQALYLTNHPNYLTPALALGTLVAGVAMIYINWEADMQRQSFRESEGRCRIWGKQPQYIVAKYQTGRPPVQTMQLGTWIQHSTQAACTDLHLRLHSCYI
jgi:7-dehydrocholesterol reductase